MYASRILQQSASATTPGSEDVMRVRKIQLRGVGGMSEEMEDIEPKEKRRLEQAVEARAEPREEGGKAKVINKLRVRGPTPPLRLRSSSTVEGLRFPIDTKTRAITGMLSSCAHERSANRRRGGSGDSRDPSAPPQRVAWPSPPTSR